jgi:hypothetical protein
MNKLLKCPVTEQRHSVADPDPESGVFLTPRSGIRDGLKIMIRIPDEQPVSYFRELRNNFYGLKYLNSLMRIRDRKNSDPGSGINIPNPQHCISFTSLACYAEPQCLSVPPTIVLSTKYY